MNKPLATAQYILSGNKKLRCGFTTGSAAAMAAKAASRLLLLNERVAEVSITTPKGWIAQSPVIYEDVKSFRKHSARAGVTKDAGDDKDATNALEIFATVTILKENPLEQKEIEIIIDGGKGVGRVTKAGLDQDVGQAAINSKPREMIASEVKAVAEEADFSGVLKVEIDIPRGEEIAKKTFNENLGIIGGISVIGTTGVVEPMSEQALIDALEVEVSVAFEAVKNKEVRPLIITPGEYGEKYLKDNRTDMLKHSVLEQAVPVKCSNFIGNVIDMAVEKGFTHLFIAGHAGKIVKIAGGIFNTHSSVADCRMEIIASHAALCGACLKTIQDIMKAVTVDSALDILLNESQKLYESVLKSISEKIKEHLKHRIGENVSFGYLCFTHKHGLLFTEPF